MQAQREEQIRQRKECVQAALQKKELARRGAGYALGYILGYISH